MKHTAETTVSQTTNEMHISKFGMVSVARGFSSASLFSKLGLSMKAAVGAIADPHLRGDLVAVLGETTGELSLRSIQSSMRSDPVGQRILIEKPTLQFDESYVSQLEALGPSTVGGAFAYVMKLHGLTIGERPPVKHVDDPELAYVMTRYRETHDLVHAILGLPISVAGEVGAKWFEMIQTGLPMTALAAFVGPLQMEQGEFGFGKEYIEWSVKAGNKCGLFCNIYFEEDWDEPLVDFRKRIGVPTFPPNVARLDHPSLSSDPAQAAALLIAHYQEAINHVSTSNSKGVEERTKVFEIAIGNLEEFL